MAREDLHFRLRIPDELKAKVEEAAQANHRSMTAEIIARLEASFKPFPEGLFRDYQGEALKEQEAKAKIDEIARRVDEIAERMKRIETDR